MNRTTTRSDHRLPTAAVRRLPAVVALAALSLTCADDPGAGEANDTVLEGVAFLGGPISDAEVIAYQIETATGLRTGERGRARTGPTGTFTVNLGGTFNSVEIDVIGGSYVDVASGAIVQRGPAVLHGLALDLEIAEKRKSVAVTPWSHLVYALGERRATVDGEGGRLGALKHARDLFTTHLGFDPTHTALAAPDQPTTTATPEFLHGVSVAGLAMRAKLANEDGFADVTGQTFVDVLDQDARGGDPDHAFDGNGDELAVTAVCPLPPPPPPPLLPCTVRGAGCYSTCTVSPHLLRAHLGGGVRAYLREHTGSGQTAATLATWLEGIRTADQPILFPPGDPEPYDNLAPHIVWAAPAVDGGTVANEIRIDVAADDPSDVASLTVVVERPDGSIQRAVVDTDPAPDRFVAMLDTRGLDEGTMVLRATATDSDGNVADEPIRTLDLNNIAFGTVTVTVAVSGRVAGAPVRVYAFDMGMPGALLGEAMAPTNLDGIASNIQIADGYSGPLLIEAGGAGTYREDAAPAGIGPVDLDVNDLLRTVVGDYRDGDALSSVVISPLSSFGVAYFRYRHSPGGDIAADWTLALGAMEAHFSVANLRTLAPLRPDQMVTLGAATRHGMDLIGLSGLALAASTEGGGTGGSYGSTMNAMTVVRVLERDIRDGCWDGWDRGPTGGPTGTPLVFGGTEAPNDDTTRRTLANAIVAYLGDGARNQTPSFGSAADVLSLLDTLSSGGGNTATGSCVGTVSGQVFDDDGGPFDRTPPRIDFIGATPVAAFVRGTIMVEAEATDLPDMLDPEPTLIFLPAGMPLETPIDTDGDTTDSDVHATFDTTARADGPLVVTLQATDDSSNSATATRTFTVDNTPPLIVITGVTDGAWYGGSGPMVGFSVDEDNLDTASATLDSLPFSSGGTVSSHGLHTLIVTARDLAGATASRTVTFYVDPIAPTLALGPVTPSGAIVRGPLTVTAIADDNLRAIGSLGADIVVTATGPSGAVAPTSTNPSTLGDGRRQVAPVFDTTAVPDGMLTVRFDVSDRAGNPAAPSLTLTRTIDNTAPVPTVAGVTAGAWYGAPRMITFGQSDANPGTTTALLDGVLFTSGGMAATEGTHTLVITATDAAGGTGTLSVTFTIDLERPTLELVGPPPPTWVRGTLMLEVIASDTLATSGSLDSDIAVIAIGPNGPFMPVLGPDMISGGRRRLTVTINTPPLGDGALSLTFTITDRAGHTASPLVINNRTIDNTAPNVTLLPVQNQTGVMLPGFVNEGSATITGTVPMGGSPVTVSVSVSPAGGTGMVPANSGAFSYTTAALPADGTYSIAASAMDAAGNPGTVTTESPLSFVVDRTGPTITFAPSSALDERGCDVVVNVSLASPLGGIGASPVVYTCTAAQPRSLHNATAATEVGKFTNRLTATAADNPLQWMPTADDGTGVGLVVASATIQSEVFRTSGFPLGAWVDSVGPTISSGDVSATVYATAAQWPQLATHTAAFSVIIRARDRLGNVTAMPPIITWTNRPLAPPVLVRYVGVASTTDPLLGPFSLFRHGLGTPIGLASAMSSGGIYNDAPRGLYEFEVWNPHVQSINVGFYLPAFAGAAYLSQVWQVNPYINGTNGIVSNPPGGTCGWNAETTSFRMTGGSAPFNCASGTACTCFNPPGSPEPVDQKPSATTAALTTNLLTIAAWNGNTGIRLTPQALTPMLAGYPFYEFAAPPAYQSNPPGGAIDRAGRMRVLVALPNLDLWTPAVDTFDAVQESDGVGAEVHVYEVGATRFSPIMTGAFYERWADCRATNASGFCSNMHARRRLRATVRADVSVPMNVVNPYVRARAGASTTATPEPIPDEDSSDGQLRAGAAVSWINCETTMPFACPTIPDMMYSQPF